MVFVRIVNLVIITGKSIQPTTLCPNGHKVFNMNSINSICFDTIWLSPDVKQIIEICGSRKQLGQNEQSLCNQRFLLSSFLFDRLYQVFHRQFP